MHMSSAFLTQLIGRTLSNKYAIEALIGTGGMGAVFRARHIALDKVVAVKVLHREFADEPKLLERFQREALAASRLDHPNSLRVLDFGEDEGLVFLVMEYLPAEDLLAVMNREWPLDDGRVVRILSQALAALAIAHDLGIVHRDLKPENILLVHGEDDEGAATEVVKVCDFGVVKMLPRTARDSDLFARSLTTEGIAVGTPDYMSPEQARGGNVDGRSDLYSIGVVLYHLIAGRTPFIADSALAVALQHVSDDPSPPSSFRDVHPELEAICLRALAKRPEDRFQSAREMRRALRAALEQPDVSSYSTPPLVLTRRMTTPGFTSYSDEPGLRSCSPRKERRGRSISRLRQTVTAAAGGALIAATIAGSVPAARRELQRQARAQWNVVEAVVAEHLQAAHHDITEISADPAPVADFALVSERSSSRELDGGTDGIGEVCPARSEPAFQPAPERAVGAPASPPKARHPSAMSGRPKLEPSLISAVAGARDPSAEPMPLPQTTDAKLGAAVDSAALSAAINTPYP